MPAKLTRRGKMDHVTEREMIGLYPGQAAKRSHSRKISNSREL